MKKLLAILTIVLLLFVSCYRSSDICYYAYFEERAFILVYSSEKNTLYEIDIPVDILKSWGEINGQTSIRDIMTSFAGLQRTGFMSGSILTLEAIDEIIDTIAEKEPQTSLQRLETVAANVKLFDNAVFLGNINRLTSTEIRPLVRVFSMGPEICCIDSGTFLPEDVEFAQKYFRQWINQVLY